MSDGSICRLVVVYVVYVVGVAECGHFIGAVCRLSGGTWVIIERWVCPMNRRVTGAGEGLFRCQLFSFQ